MMMEPLFFKFPEISGKETRSITIQDDSLGLMAGKYSFVELFCNEADCDCRRAMIQVVGPGNKFFATLSYAWEDLSFYTDWMFGDKDSAKSIIGIQLYTMSPQTEYSDRLLAIFQNLLEDSNYANRIKSHYELFKKGTSPSLPKKMRSPFSSKFFAGKIKQPSIEKCLIEEI